MKKILVSLLVSGLAIVWGCDASKPKPLPPEPAPPAAVIPPAPQPEPPAPEAPAEEPKPQTERVEAKAGVTGKGQYGQAGGEKASDILTVPVATLWSTKEKMVYDVQVPEAMKYYKVEHDGKGPTTHEEFMKEVIEKNMIVLPKLQEGHQYIYDPETEKLMVEKPR